MKIKIQIRQSLLLLFLVCAIQGVAQDNNSIVGQWKVDAAKSLELKNTQEKSKYDSLPEHVKSRAISSMEGRKFSFFENGTVSILWSTKDGEKVSNGTWHLTSENILSISVEGNESKFDCTVNAQSLIFDAHNKKGLFNKLFLTKLN